MTRAQLEAALRDIALRGSKVTSATAAKIIFKELTPLADAVPTVIPPILERRKSDPEPGSTMNRPWTRRGRATTAQAPPPPPGATQLAMSTQPAGFRDSTVGDTQPAARLKDADGNNILQAGLNVSVSITSGSGSFAAGTTQTVVTDSNGIATFSGLKIVGSGTHVLTFTCSGLTGVASTSFSVNAATKVVMSTQPAGASDGTPFSTQPAVRLQDATSANVTKSGISVTASIVVGSGTITAGSSATTDSSGIATFSGLTITGSGSHTLRFTPAGGLSTVDSNSFTVDVVAGNPTPSGTIILDTRAGGNADIQAAGVTTFLGAFNTVKAAVSTGEYAQDSGGNPQPDFTTNLDGAGKHAFVFKHPSWGGVDQDGGGGWIRPYLNTPYPTEWYFQFKQWQGRTATGGGIGTVGAYDITNEDCPNPIAGHKEVLFCRYNAADTGGCGARADFVFGGPSPVSPGMEGWYGQWEGTGRLLFNVSSWNPEDHYNETNTYTLYVKVSSTDNATDGVYKCWVNGVLRANHTNLYIGSHPLQRFDVPSVFRSPHFDMTEYIWDIVLWTP